MRRNTALANAIDVAIGHDEAGALMLEELGGARK